jgi:predicted transcriptional regulator of viral defense system
MRLRDFLNRHPVFTVAELGQFLAEEGTGNRRTRESMLTYHRRHGHVVPVRRGLYVAAPAGTSPEAVAVDPYLLAARMTEDAVLAYHTALEFHGRAYSTYHRFVYLTSRRSLPVVFRSYEFRPASFPAALATKGQEGFGVITAERAGLPVRVTSLERTMVDVLDRPNLAGSWEEIWRSLESVEYYDLEMVVQYALLLGNATTVAKVGYFLSQHRERLMVSDAHLELLREHRPRTPHYLVRRDRTGGSFEPDWNLVVPREIVERSWAEVL